VVEDQRVPAVLHVLGLATGRHFELTKSLLNILFNLVKTQSIRPFKTTKQTIGRNEELVWRLLSPAASLDEKTRRLADSLDLVYALARSCPSSES
jgi:hypothetical protein